MACPDPSRLKDLLDGNLPEAEQQELNQHLETCETCQRTLEGLVAGGESWSKAAWQLNETQATPEPALEEAMAGLKGDRTETHFGDGHADGVSLDFLTPTDQPGRLGKLDHYEIIDVVGKGGFGVVLKAFDPELHRHVAIKVLSPHLATSTAARKRFQREAKAAAAVSHEHVVAIHAVDVVKDLPYLVMQYVAGASLQERIDRDGPLQVQEILRIGMQAARGLAAAHAQGLVHRDIKPANILLENGVERVKISDFGLARAVDDASVTQSGVIAGTPQYMSPEQARGESVDHRTDLFSLGSVLYAMCTGRPPFRASTTMGVLKRVSDDTPRPVRDINPDIPDWLSAIIDKLHAKNTGDRFQSAGEVADLLGQHLAHLQQPGVVPRPATMSSLRKTVAGDAALRLTRAERSAPSFRPAALGTVTAFVTGMILQWVVATIQGRITKADAWPIAILSLLTGVGVTIHLSKRARRRRVAGAERSEAPVETRRGVEDSAPATRPGLLGISPLVWWTSMLLVLPLGVAVLDGFSVLPGTMAEYTGLVLAGLAAVFLVFLLVAALTSLRRGSLSATAGPRPGRAGLIVAGLVIANAVVLPNWIGPWDRFRTLFPLRAATLDFDPQEGMDNVRVVVMRNGAEVGRVDVSTTKTIRLPAGAYQLTVEASRPHPPNEVLLIPSAFGLSAGQRKTVQIWRNWPAHKSVEPGFVPLFNGRDLSGWKPHPALPGKWRIEDGCIVGTGPDSYLFSEREYEHFHLRLKAKIVARGASSISIRMPYSLQPNPMGGFLFLGGGVDAQLGGPGANEWYECEIIVRGEEIQTKVNGKTIMHRQAAKPNRRGHFALHVWSEEGKPAVAHFKEIEIKELPPPSSPTSAKTDHDRIQGVWRAVTGEHSGGQPFTPEMLRRFRVVFHGDRIRSEMPDGFIGIGTFALETAKEPKRLTVIADKVFFGMQGIYTWEGDRPGERLKVCMSPMPEDPRPTEFVSKAGTKVAVVTLERDPSANAAEIMSFVPLFNGCDLAGWKTHPQQPGDWKVENGVLIGSGKKSHLFSDRADFGDFHLRVEARINDGGNGGVYFRVPKFALPHLSQYPDGYEAQILSTSKTEANTTGSLWRTLGGDIGIIPARKPPPKPGEWFTMEVIAQRGSITVKVNGETTADFLDSKREYLKGHLALQVIDAQTTVEFRKIEIKELPGAAAGLGRQPLDGGWVHVAAEYRGKPVPPEQAKDQFPSEMLIKGDQYGITWAGTQHEGGLRIDPTKNPAEIDFTGSVFAGLKPRKAIYELHGDRLGDRLKLCLPFVGPNADPPRPTSFTTDPQSQNAVLTYRREGSASSDGFIPLFNGRDLTGWKTQPDQPGQWKVEEGVITCTGPRSHLFTERGDFENFHLRVEARINAKGDSGVFFRGPFDALHRSRMPMGYELHISPTYPEFKTGSLCVAEETGAPYLTRESRPLAPPDTWFTLDIIARGERLILKVNDTQVADIVNKRFAKGHIALQHWGAETVVQFRKIEIKELPPAAPSKPQPGAAKPGQDHATTGTIKGMVTYNGPENEMTVRMIKPNKDADKLPPELPAEGWYVKDKKTKGVQYAVVFVQTSTAAALPKPATSNEPTQPEGVVRMPRGTFVPRVLLLHPRQNLKLINDSDPPIHLDVNIANLRNLTPPKTLRPAESQVFQVAPFNKEPIRVSCAQHAGQMSGYVWKMNHPYVAVTDAEGRFELKHVPVLQDEKVVLWVWHEMLDSPDRMKEIGPVAVKPDEAVEVQVAIPK